MPYRNIAREDLWEEHFHRWGYTALFMVAVVRCKKCEQSFRATSQPMKTYEDVLTECLRIVAREGWRVHDQDGPLCSKCLKETQPSHFPGQG